MKRSGCDEQDMVGTHWAITAIDRGALDHRQQVTLDALARNIRAMRRWRAAYLVQLIDENNPLILDERDGLLRDYGTIDQGLGFLLQENAAGLLDRNLPLLALPRHDFLEHALKIDIHLLHAQVGKNLNWNGLLLNSQLDLTIFKISRFEPGFHLVAGALTALIFLR